VKRQAGKGGAYVVGGFVISTRSDVEYFDFKMLEYVQGWRKKWFYIHDEPGASQQFGLPEFSAEEVVTKKRSWRHELSTTEAAEADRLMARVLELQKTVGKEVAGVQIISTFIRRRVQPLQARAHAMWQYTGAADPTRVHKEKLSTNELETRIRSLTTLTAKDSLTSKPSVAPYGEGKELPVVIFYLQLLSELLWWSAQAIASSIAGS
jgi:hypothetical protein